MRRSRTRVADAAGSMRCDDVHGGRRPATTAGTWTGRRRDASWRLAHALPFESLTACQATTITLRVTVTDGAEAFARDRALLSEKLEGLQSVVPREPLAESFVATLGKLSPDYGVRITDWTIASARAEGILQEHVLTLSMEGDVRNLVALAERTEKMVRLSVWDRALVSGGRARVEVAVYSAPDSPARRRADACAHPMSGVWLWPYTEKVAVGRRAVDEGCRHVGRFASVQEQVDEYQAKKVRMEALVVAIEKAMARRRPLEIVTDEAPKRAVAAAPEA